MASPQPRSEAQERAVKTKHELPGPGGDILTKSLQIGASAGACGLLFGATAGIVRGTTPVLFSLASGFQWFGLGSIYYGENSLCRSYCTAEKQADWQAGTRALTIASHGHQHQITPSQKVEASALGGAVSGTTMGGIFRIAFSYIQSLYPFLTSSRWAKKYPPCSIGVFSAWGQWPVCSQQVV